jgi:beta-lactamase class A
MMTKRTIIFIAGGITILGAGMLVGFYIPRFISSSTTTTTYQFINPTVSSNIKKHFIINFAPLRKQLLEIQKKYPQKTYIYFNYLNNGSWVGINERDLFVAASTIKVPLAMALFKAVEEGKLKLTDSYSLEELDLDENFGNLYKVGTNKEFTVQELVKIMLEQSDNTAMKAIFHIFEKIGIDDPLINVYGFMGWDINTLELVPDIGQTPNYQDINLKTLSNMFLSLYNATYVSPEHSEQILEYLANSPFNEKIVAGVPESIPVAHKIGIAANAETFSDCGIIYAPNRHYLLCLGSNGGDENLANKFMAEVSKAVYDFVINN